MAALSALPILAQDGREVSGPVEEPTELGLRFTPEMARGIARLYTKDMLVRRYELPEDQVDEVAEDIARRLMQQAHKLDTPEFQGTLEKMFGGILNGVADQQASGDFGMPKKAAQAFAEGVQPMLPGIRELVRGIGQDVRPRLGFKMQFKFSADMMTFGTGLEVFAETMERWAKGDVKDDDNPFSPRRQESPERINEFRENAKRMSEVDPWHNWERYIKEAKEFYQMDAAQAATADAVLRQMTGEAEQLVRRSDYSGAVYRQTFYSRLLWRRGLRGGDPVNYLLNRDHRKVAGPVEELFDQLKRRIDEIPTDAQRRVAEEQVAAKLAEKGFDPKQQGNGEEE